MVITAADFPVLAAVRQLEALGSRAWVAENTAYDRTWACCWTPGYPSCRLNSVTPLDPADGDDVAERITRLCLRSRGRALPLRATPLIPPAVIRYCEENNWKQSRRVSVLTASLQDLPVLAEDTVEVVADADYAVVSLANRVADPALNQAFVAVLHRIKGQKFPFILKKDRLPVANMLVVRDGRFAGIFDFTVGSSCCRQDMGHSFIATVLQKLKEMQVARVWLQVRADDAAAFRLYQSFGFACCYDYTYWSFR